MSRRRVLGRPRVSFRRRARAFIRRDTARFRRGTVHSQRATARCRWGPARPRRPCIRRHKSCPGHRLSSSSRFLWGVEPASRSGSRGRRRRGAKDFWDFSRRSRTAIATLRVEGITEEDLSMLSLRTRPVSARPVTSKARRVRVDSPTRPAETPESVFLRLWVARQASLHADLLKTIAHAPCPRRGTPPS